MQGRFGILAKKSHHTLEWLYCCVVSHGIVRSAGQTSLVIVLEREGVCQGLDPGSCWPPSHLFLATANPQEGRLLVLPDAAWHDARNQNEVKHKYGKPSLAFAGGSTADKSRSDVLCQVYE